MAVSLSFKLNLILPSISVPTEVLSQSERFGIAALNAGFGDSNTLILNEVMAPQSGFCLFVTLATIICS